MIVTCSGCNGFKTVTPMGGVPMKCPSCKGLGQIDDPNIEPVVEVVNHKESINFAQYPDAKEEIMTTKRRRKWAKLRAIKRDQKMVKQEADKLSLKLTTEVV